MGYTSVSGEGGGGGYFLGAKIFGQNYKATYLQQEHQRIKWFSQTENKSKSVLELELEPCLWLSFNSNVF